MNRSGAGTRLLVFALLVGVVSGCGAPTDGRRALDSDAVPYELLSPAPSPTSTTVAPSPGPGQVSAELYFVGPGDVLVAVPITTESERLEDLLPEVLTRLAAGPGEESTAAELTTALGPDVGLRLTEVVGTTAYVDVLVEDRRLTADQIPRAVGQIVLTTTSVSGIATVVLLVDGEQVDVPLPGGERTARPLSATDYLELTTVRTPT